MHNIDIIITCVGRPLQGCGPVVVGCVSDTCVGRYVCYNSQSVLTCEDLDRETPRWPPE